MALKCCFMDKKHTSCLNKTVQAQQWLQWKSWSHIFLTNLCSFHHVFSLVLLTSMTLFRYTNVKPFFQSNQKAALWWDPSDASFQWNLLLSLFPGSLLSLPRFVHMLRHVVRFQMCQLSALSHEPPPFTLQVGSTVGHAEEPLSVSCCHHVCLFLCSSATSSPILLVPSPPGAPPHPTHPSPQSAHFSTLTPQNYANSLSGRQYEWKDGGRKGRQICLCSTTQRCLYSAPSQLSADKSSHLNRKTSHPVNLLISKCMYSLSRTDWDDIFLDLHRFLWDYSVILWLWRLNFFAMVDFFSFTTKSTCVFTSL